MQSRAAIAADPPPGEGLGRSRASAKDVNFGGDPLIFHCDDLQFELLDVLYFNERDIAYCSSTRQHCAISLRLEADSDLEFRTETIHMTTGDLAFFPPELVYVRRARRDEMIVFHLHLIRGTLPVGVEVLHDAPMERLLPLFQAALTEWLHQEPGFRYRASALLYRIFGELQENSESSSENRNPIVRDAVEYMLSDFADPGLTVARVAERLHISETYLRRIFHREMGGSPKQYLNRLRMERAKALLNAGYDPVSMVAEKVGFRDTKNFATAYKKTYGYPPSEQHY